MMESIDDDIFILNNQDTLDGSVGDSNVRLKPQDFVISRAGAGVRPDPAVHALQQAYTNLKKRYNETVQRNQQITRVLRDVRGLKGPDSDMASYGDGEDSYSSSAQGAAATGEHVCQADNFRAQQGYVRYLEREKVSLEAKLQQMSSVRNSVDSMQTKLRETVSSLQRKEDDLRSAHETIQDLKTENMRLREDRSEYCRHATDLQEHLQESLQSSVEKQSKEYDELQQKFQKVESELVQVREECDRLKVSESLAKEELQLTKSKLADYEQRYDNLVEAYSAVKEQLRTSETGGFESSMPTTREMDYLKKVIADLRKTVIQQREFLGNLGKPGTITNVRSDAVPVFPRQEDVGLGQSWETVPKFLPASPQLSAQVNPQLPMRRTRASDGAIDLSPYADQHSRSEILRKKPSRSSSPRSKSEVIMKAPEMPRNTFNYHPEVKSPVLVVSGSNMNGGSAGLQSIYDNMSSVPRRKTPEIVSDFGDNTDDTPLQVPAGLREGSSVDRYHPVADRTGCQEASRGQAVEEKICPVCSRDFSAMLIEDFQTHVFECFDDHSAPETLRPSNQNERICPMCNKLYPESVSQEEFEKHVQTHFEENITDRFEILEP